MKRIFKDIPNYENTYKISNYGEILKFKSYDSRNHYEIDLNSLEVNHKGESKLNNYVNNLEWCSHKYNTNYGTMQERQLKAWRKSRKEDIYA